MRKILASLAFILLALPAHAANFSAKDAAAATIIFTNPGNCTTGCTPIFAWTDSTGANVVGVITAGADAASNTATGGITYSRTMTFNGTTWDRWTGAVTATLAAETTKVIGTVRIASGGVASGSFASGSIASGALASGSIASGAMVDLGTQTDAVAATPSTGSAATLIALAKAINNNVSSAIPAGSNVIGALTANQSVNTAQVNGVTTSTGTGAVGTGSQRVAVGTDTATIAGSAPGTQTAPSSNYVAVNSGDPCFGAAKTTAAFSTSSAGPVSIVALSGSTKVYICSITAINDTAIKLSFIDGTGGSCASAQHAIWGSTTAASGMSLAATGGFTSGNGGGTVGVTAAASAFCLLQSGTSLVAGSITYVQQ